MALRFLENVGLSSGLASFPADSIGGQVDNRVVRCSQESLLFFLSSESSVAASMAASSPPQCLCRAGNVPLSASNSETVFLQ